ncbi:unnamed protein product [Strongylus vulgaris]|uniref:Uncharacterized protein n=1 Tax=Strongylus vulgaris TaxID=40348 RepID=A0A3P7JTX3_STRVU|nr:unnamed protein product [Strongylus vulgaris]
MFEVNHRGCSLNDNDPAVPPAFVVLSLNGARQRRSVHSEEAEPFGYERGVGDDVALLRAALPSSERCKRSDAIHQDMDELGGMC